MNYSSGASVSTAPTLITNGSGSIYAVSSSDSACFEEKWRIRRQQYQNRWISGNEECLRQSSTQFLGLQATSPNEDYVYMNDTYDQQQRAAIIAHNRRMQYLTDQLNTPMPTFTTVNVVPRIPQKFYPLPGIKTGKELPNDSVDCDDLKQRNYSVVRNGERIANKSAGSDSIRRTPSVVRYFAKLFSCTSSAAADTVVDSRRTSSLAFTASTLSVVRYPLYTFFVS